VHGAKLILRHLEQRLARRNRQAKHLLSGSNFSDDLAFVDPFLNAPLKAPESFSA